MTTLYEKRGRRYYPVREERVWDSWPAGFHLVYSNPHGGRAISYHVDPDTARMLAAAKEREEEIRKVLVKALAMRPTKRPVTERQAKAWKEFQAAMGNDGYCVEYESVNGIIDAMIAELLR